ncbi:hypothetical protein Tco_0608905 [Tanacetum coccineum]
MSDDNINAIRTFGSNLSVDDVKDLCAKYELLGHLEAQAPLSPVAITKAPIGIGAPGSPLSESLPRESERHLLIPGTDNQEKDEKQRQNDKTGLGMEKTVKDKAKSKPENHPVKKVNRKVNWSKSKSTQVNPGAKVKEI